MLKKIYYNRQAKKSNAEADMLMKYNRSGLKTRYPEPGSKDFQLKTVAENTMAQKRKEIEKRLKRGM